MKIFLVFLALGILSLAISITMTGLGYADSTNVVVQLAVGALLGYLSSYFEK